MKLYELPRNTYFRISGEPQVYFFHHIDGMYSYCTFGDYVIHINATTEVEPFVEGEQPCL